MDNKKYLLKRIEDVEYILQHTGNVFLAKDVVMVLFKEIKEHLTGGNNDAEPSVSTRRNPGH